MMRALLITSALFAALAGCQANTAVTSAATPVASASPSTPPSAAPSVVAYDAPRATPEQVKTRQAAGDSFLVVDVRPASSFKGGHIQGAVNHPWATLKQADPGFPRDKFILLYCT